MKLYYMLEPGDRIQPGDEYLPQIGDEWIPCKQVGWELGISDQLPRRRPVTAEAPEKTNMNYPDPINADRCYPTEQDCEQGLILGYDHDGRWKFMSPFGFKMRELRWWLRVPPKPPETVVPDWERAWEREAYYNVVCQHGDKKWSSKDAYRLGYEAGCRDGARDGRAVKAEKEQG